MGKDLLIACAVGDIKWVKLCIANGADPLLVNSEGWSALHLAAMNTKLNCIEYLVDNLKIDCNVASKTGWTPLHLAARGKPEYAALDCVTYLISQGSEVNKVNDMGIGSVHQAVSANNLKCLSTLVKHGAYVTRTDKRGLLPIDVAKVWGHSECSKYLENVMWFEKKRKEEEQRRKWVLEHKKLLEEEMKKYAESKRSDKIHQAYNSWIERKKCASPRLPSHSESRARSLPCFQETTIHDYHKKYLSRKVKEGLPAPKSRPRQYSPRVQLERVKKIQELRSMLTSRDTRVSRDQPAADQHTTDTRPAKKLVDSSPLIVSRLEQHDSGPKAVYPAHYRVSKHNSEIKSNRKRRKNMNRKTVIPSYDPMELPLKVDNYFKLPTDSSTPDSGFVDNESAVNSPTIIENDNMLKVDHDQQNLELESVKSEEFQDQETTDFLTDNLNTVLRLADNGSPKTVRFSNNVFYDTEHDSVSFGNSLDKLRSCIKIKSSNLNEK